MMSKTVAIQCAMALVLLLLVLGQSADLKFPVKGKWEFNKRLRAIPHLQNLPKLSTQVIGGLGGCDLAI